jgi:co-chaperonin GroES (HSP10)
MEEPTIDAVLERARETARNLETVPLEQKRKRLRPRHQWVVIRKVDAKDRLAKSGIVITEGQAGSSVGEVVSFSPEVKDLTRGDLVLYTNFAIKLEDMEDATGDKTLQLVREEEIYVVLENED